MIRRPHHSDPRATPNPISADRPAARGLPRTAAAVTSARRTSPIRIRSSLGAEGWTIPTITPVTSPARSVIRNTTTSGPAKARSLGGRAAAMRATTMAPAHASQSGHQGRYLLSRRRYPAARIPQVCRPLAFNSTLATFSPVVAASGRLVSLDARSRLGGCRVRTGAVQVAGTPATESARSPSVIR